ncbi:unnamed protein product [Orchesella dallaii]|uniref:MYND-type domain-containing protein n=1 Tax=Orchesella dallaii TaxID=48710 RepID=A0ABP1QCS4_9HEXA
MRKSRKMATLLNTDSAKASSKLESDKEDNNGNCQPGKAIATSKLTSTGDDGEGAKANPYIRSDASLLEMERVNLILAHRNMLQQGVLIFGSPLFNSHTKVFMTFSAPDNKSKPVKNIESLKPIYVNDINKLIEDKSYCNFKGTIIKLMSIDDASVGQQSTRLVVEDGNKSTYRLIIYNYPYDSCPKQPSPENVAIIQRNLGFGSVISIMNPYVKRCAYDAEAYLRVEDSSTLIYHREESKVNRCRYCYKPEADYRCSLCRRHYCSRICQKKDWKINQHKLICGIKFREL